MPTDPPLPSTGSPTKDTFVSRNVHPKTNVKKTLAKPAAFHLYYTGGICVIRTPSWDLFFRGQARIGQNQVGWHSPDGWESKGYEGKSRGAGVWSESPLSIKDDLFQLQNISAVVFHFLWHWHLPNTITMFLLKWRWAETPVLVSLGFLWQVQMVSYMLSSCTE